MLHRTTLTVLIAALTLSQAGAAASSGSFAHVRAYNGEFTLDWTAQGYNETQHEHATITLHLARSYPDGGNRGTELLWQGYGQATATYSDANCSGSASAPPRRLLVELFEDLGRGEYQLNTYGVQVNCNSSEKPSVGGFSATPSAAIPSYRSIICGTMTVQSAGDFTEHDSWSFTPVVDDHSTILNPGCPQVTPPPQKEE